jgi:hypothetical protein
VKFGDVLFGMVFVCLCVVIVHFSSSSLLLDVVHLVGFMWVLATRRVRMLLVTIYWDLACKMLGEWFYVVVMDLA